MKLYYSPGACSIGIRLILEETGAPFTCEKLDLAGRQQLGADFVAINAKSKVPTLVRDDGSVLTEFPAIALWLGLSFPERQMVPADAEGMARSIEMIDYIVATMHMQGFTRIFRPANFSPDPNSHEEVKARGREIFQKGLQIVDASLSRLPTSPRGFTIADGALFYISFWASARLQQPLPERLAKHYTALKARPSARKVLTEEGFEAELSK
ncbi:MAG: hypothetical protein AB7L76_25350 [Burkholderiaceae bacterium]